MILAGVILLVAGATALDPSLPANCFRVPTQRKSNVVESILENIASVKPSVNLHSANSGKNPMMLLNEVAMYNKVRYEYRVIEENGPAHARQFTVALRLLDQNKELGEYYGFGKKIRDAQHDAAASALRNSPLPHPLLRSKNKHKKTNEEIVNESTCPISAINTLSQRLNIPAIYTFKESGPPHAKTFTTICEFRGLTSQGEGGSKKKSKTDAARSMLNAIGPSSAIPQMPAKKRKRKNKSKNKRSIPRDLSSSSAKSNFMKWANGGDLQGSMTDAILSTNDDILNSGSDYLQHKHISPKIQRKSGDVKLAQSDNLPSGYDQLDKFAKSSDYNVEESNVKSSDGKHISVLEMKSLNPKNSDIVCFGEDAAVNKAQELSVQGAINYFLHLENNNVNSNITSYSSLDHWKKKIHLAMNTLKSSLKYLSAKVPQETISKYSKYMLEFKEL